MSRRYIIHGTQLTAATNSGICGITGAATHRAKVYDIIIGSQAAAADAHMSFALRRSTTAGTGTGSPTAEALNPDDPAADTTVAVDYTANPTAGATMVPLPLNQRATFRWVANPGSEIWTPATAANGLFIDTVVRNGTDYLAEAAIYWEE
jgi:hypothetical protein